MPHSDLSNNSDSDLSKISDSDLSKISDSDLSKISDSRLKLIYYNMLKIGRIERSSALLAHSLWSCIHLVFIAFNQMTCNAAKQISNVCRKSQHL